MRRRSASRNPTNASERRSSRSTGRQTSHEIALPPRNRRDGASTSNESGNDDRIQASNTEMNGQSNGQTNGSCFCGPNFYAKVLGPTADETILVGLQTLFGLSEVCPPAEPPAVEDEEPEPERQEIKLEITQEITQDEEQEEVVGKVSLCIYNSPGDVCPAECLEDNPADNESDESPTDQKPEVKNNNIITEKIQIDYPVANVCCQLQEPCTGPNEEFDEIENTERQAKSNEPQAQPKIKIEVETRQRSVSKSDQCCKQPAKVSGSCCCHVSSNGEQRYEIQSTVSVTNTDTTKSVCACRKTPLRSSTCSTCRSNSAKTASSRRNYIQSQEIFGRSSNCSCSCSPPPSKTTGYCECCTSTSSSGMEEIECFPESTESTCPSHMGDGVTVRYAITKITKFYSYTTFEVMKSTKRKPKYIPKTLEGVFVLKNCV